MDFYQVRTKRTKEGLLVYPDFTVQNSKDLLVKGRAFYAIWDEVKGLWSRDEMAVARMVDDDLYKKAEEVDGMPLLMSSFESQSWKQWKQYVQSLDDSDVDLDTTLTFADDPPDRKKYASRRLPYSLTEGECPAYEELISTLYVPVEREKIEWMIGSLISGESRTNQKFFVFHGKSGFGKSTVIGIMEQLFPGYYIPVDMKLLGTASNSFAMAGFKSNPLLAIQHDGDLSKIEDNTKLNSIVSHEYMPINEKFKAEYYSRILALLVLGTNEPVKITGSKSGIIRRLIDITPSGDLVENRHYHVLMNQIAFELGAIAQHCLGVYYSLGKNYYANYKPTKMMYETDVFFNFIEHYYDTFYTEDGITLDRAWQLYKDYCEDALVKHRLQRNQFRAELQSYFKTFEERGVLPDGTRVRSYFSGFETHRFLKVDDTKPLSMDLDQTTSILDDILADQPAQYANADGTPRLYWTNEERDIKGKLKKPTPEQVVSTTLSDLDTHELHYLKVPKNLLVVDFDLKDEHGNKSRERNLAAAAEWPHTYAEFSQSGEGVHIYYWWDGAAPMEQISPSYKEDIEIKTLLGNSSLRRRLSLCNNAPIATISSGLPLKEKPMHDSKAMASEKSVRKLLIENMQKVHVPGTKPSIEFIKKILNDAYTSGIPYDVSDLYADVYSFAMSSTNHARYCMNLVKEMKFQSEDLELQVEANNDRLVFFDVEVFPNLFVVCYKFAGESNFVRMINPSQDEIDTLLGYKLVGFNCRRYDNHIIYAAAQGMTVAQLYDISQRIISGDRSAMFGAAYELSYTDIYDFSSKKQSLKKFEIELGLKHLELGLPWDEPVPEELWDKVAEYCENDVLATEATFEARKADFIARQILAELSGMTVNATTQNHTARIIFGKERNPQKEFIYTHLKEEFPGYVYNFGTSTYRDEVVGEGGYVYAEPGVHKNVALLDVASMHPSTIEILNMFGPYTQKFSELKAARIFIKRGELNKAKEMLDGRLAPYLNDENEAEALSYALKIVINIVYGLTSAKFENAFRDPRNQDNICAKRGALFMIDLKHAVQEQGFTVAHIKTDSIKIPEATPEIIDFVFKFGEKYGYEFEHEATYDEFVLFNDAVYIARNTPEKVEAGKPLWEATGAQFLHPYVFKTILSGEAVVFDDLCETKNVAKGSIFIAKGENLEDRRFIGRIGRFVPLLPGSGGGTLLRVAEVEVFDKDENGLEIPGTRRMVERDYAVTGTKGWEWLEDETVKELGLEDKVDMSYFEHLVEKARESMRSVGYI